MKSNSEYLDDLHGNGIHIRCGKADVWLKSIGKRVGDGTYRKCARAGRIERLHSHEYDGPLVCGCEEDVLG